MRYLRQDAVIPQGKLAPPLQETIELFELRGAERTLHVGNAVVESDLAHLVIPRIQSPVRISALRMKGGVIALVDAVTAQSQQILVERSAVGGDHAAFRGGDDFDRMKGKDGHIRISAAADRPAI